jgi:hypothetical protein
MEPIVNEGPVAKVEPDVRPTGRFQPNSHVPNVAVVLFITSFSIAERVTVCYLQKTPFDQ